MRLVVTWAPGQMPDPLDVRIKRVRWALGHDSFTFRRTIYTTRKFPSQRHIRHELVHVAQFTRYGTLGFLWRYFVRGRRREMEGEAEALAGRSWPQWLTVGG